MSQMVERVARALSGNSPEWDSFLPVVRDQFRTQARAAIEAMREPTTLMTIAPKRIDAFCEFELDGTAKIWQMMIDEALK